MNRLCAAPVFLALAFTCMAQQPSAPAGAPAAAAQPAHDASFEAERAQANQLYLAGKRLEALPLYEDLCRQDQTNPAFAERHGIGLLTKMAAATDPKQKQELTQRAIQELERARQLGDDSPAVVGVLSAFSKTPIGLAVGASLGGLPLTAGYMYQGTPECLQLLQQGQAAFNQKDFATAAKLYQQAATADPKAYTAALFAGDAYFRLKDLANAGVWFAKAIAIDPDRETAYRYWGDALANAGDFAAAKVKFEQAMAAEPYLPGTYSGLRQWGILTHTTVAAPRVIRPQFTINEGQFAEAPPLSDRGSGDSSWLVYRSVRIAHGPGVVLNQWTMAGATSGADFHFEPQGYVHTLPEEVEALKAMLMDVRARMVSGELNEARLDPGIRTMLKVEKDGMLEPFILISFNDAGLRHGYPAYRAAHRAEVIAYIDRYFIGPPLPANAPSPYVRVNP